MMDAPKKARVMYPRITTGEAVLGALRLSITDEGVYIARLAWKELAGPPSTWVQYGTRKLWADDYPVAQFAAHVGGAVMDVVEWTVT